MLTRPWRLRPLLASVVFEKLILAKTKPPPPHLMPPKLTAETLLSSRVPEIPEIDNESVGNEYGPVSLSGAP